MADGATAADIVALRMRGVAQTAAWTAVKPGCIMRGQGRNAHAHCISTLCGV